VSIGDIGKIIRQFYEFLIMGGNQPGAVLTDHVAYIGTAADQPFAIVRPFGLRLSEPTPLRK